MPHAIITDDSRDALLTDFGKETLKDRYLLPNETYQEMFARVASAYADDADHAQRIYDYISRLWFMPATPILSNAGTSRGLPISCYLNSVEDDLEGIDNIWSENVWLASKGGGIGCVDADTEYLSPKGWRRIADYDGGVIMTVEADGMGGSFNQPERYINAPATDMYRLFNSITDMVVSGDHRNFVRFDGKSPFGVKDTRYLLENGRYKNARFKPAIRSSGGHGLPYTDIELRFLVALAADGSNVKDRPDVKFGLRRHRKIERLRWILSEIGLDHDERQEGLNTIFYVADRGVEKKHLTFDHFGDASSAQLDIIFDELGYWDGSFDHRNSHLRFSTFKDDEAEFAQYVVMSATGKRAGIGKKASGEWTVRETGETSSTVSQTETFVPEDGRQYCFQTKTTFWLARRNGFIFVTGNTYWGGVRGIGEKVGLNGHTSGIIPFIKVMDSLTLAISQGSLRRGSAAVYIDISHPEIEEFLEIRKPSGDFNRKSLNIHHGVIVSDEFMDAARNGEEFTLRSPKDKSPQGTVDARSLFQKLVEVRLATGEPYILFGDTVNRAIPQHHIKSNLKVSTSNLCVEITLPTGRDHLGHERTAVCCLSSLNLETWDQWNKAPQFIEDVMRMLDNVLDDYIAKAPSKMAKAKYSAMRERSVGLGVMGFHSFLQARGLPFEGAMAKSWNLRIFKHIKTQVDAASRNLAHERGPCPDAEEHGIMERFSCKTAIAPTASISIICGGTSACIEPIPANIYTHKTLSGSFVVKNPALETALSRQGKNDSETWNSILENQGSVQHLGFLSQIEKDTFKTSFEIDQRWILELAADRTPHIDQSQSLNLFILPDSSKWDLLMLHFRAWEMGIKSLYYLRSKSVQRAGFAGGVEADNTIEAPVVIAQAVNYDECISCQ